MPTSRPILFSESMIKAILNGKKTQTRRIIKTVFEPTPKRLEFWGETILKMPNNVWVPTSNSGKIGIFEPQYLKCPYGKVGDTLWCRETWQLVRGWDDDSGDIEAWEGPAPKEHPTPGFTGHGDSAFDGLWGPTYRADNVWDGYEEPPFSWRPSIHMPRWAARISLEIKNIRVERLNDISEEDAVAEGIQAFTKDGTLMKYWACDPCDGPFKNEWSKLPRTAKEAYAALWEKINGKGSWEANPWVWVVGFSRIANEEL